jgi:uncharacterized membrane protein
MRPTDGDPRTLALSDGVFAIAMTLLVLSIHVPQLADPDEHELARALLDQRGELGSWLLSFVVVGVMWMRHRALFAQVLQVDRTMTRLNLAYLGGVAFVPYPTDVLGRYGDQPAAIALYAATLAFVSAVGGTLVAHALRAELLSEADAAARRATHARWWLGPAIVLLAVPLSLLVGTWALLVWLALPLAGRWRTRGA